MVTSPIGRQDISETLQKIRSIANQTAALKPTSPQASSTHPVNPFNEVLGLAKDAVSDVNGAQKQAETLKTAYVTGDPNVSMSQVMMSTMKSKVAFEGLLVVRNKLLEAYKEIMNMPV